jgi:hypothetical protein
VVTAGRARKGFRARLRRPAMSDLARASHQPEVASRDGTSPRAGGYERGGRLVQIPQTLAGPASHPRRCGVFSWVPKRNNATEGASRSARGILTANQASPLCFARAPRQASYRPLATANVFASEAAFSGPLARIAEARGTKQQQAHRWSYQLWANALEPYRCRPRWRTGGLYPEGEPPFIWARCACLAKRASLSL